ncbi:unnamed protein product, partial [Staurois parvus]
PQSLVIPCTVSAVSGHLLHCVRSLWSSPGLTSAVSGHLLEYVRSLWSSPVLSAVHWFRIFFPPLKPRCVLMVRCILWSEKYGYI